MSALEEHRPASEATAALELRDLDVVYKVRGRDRQVLRGVSLSVERGESYGLVGESGCGKSTAALAIVRYLPRNGRVRAGSVLVDGRDVWPGRRRAPRAPLERRLDGVPEPGRCAQPVDPGRDQIAEVFTVRGAARGEARERASRCSARSRSPTPSR